MSTETNIDFKCAECGHGEVVSLETGVTVASPVTQIVAAPWDDSDDPAPAPVLSGYSRSGGEFAGYACGGCHRVIARDAAGLRDYLRVRGMFGEWRDEG